jgi:transmembrane sensor
MNRDVRSSRVLEAEAAAWVVRRRAGFDPAAEREFTAWYGAAAEHAATFHRIEETAEAFQRARALGGAPTIVAGVKVRAHRRVRRRALVAACCAGLVALGTWWGMRPSAGERRAEISSFAGSFESLRRLPDGSVVELRDGARIAVRFGSARRRVDLVSGEALFRVVPDAGRPFVVAAAGVEVSAVGTAFNVAIAPHAVAVLVTEGKVRLDEPAATAPIQSARSITPDSLLTAGQQAIVDRPPAGGQAAEAHIRTLSEDEVKQLLAWRMPWFEFDGEALGRAVERFNQVNRLQLRIADDRVARLRISGDFMQNDPATFARLAAATFGLTVQRTGPGVLALKPE